MRDAPILGKDRCPGCGHVRSGVTGYPGAATAATHGFHFSGIATCEECGLGRAVPMPAQSDLDRYYSAGHYWNDTPASRAASAHARNQCRHRVRHALGALRGRLQGPVLDVGAGEGWIGDLLSPAPCDLVEPDPRQREKAAKRLGPKSRTFDSLAQVGGGYEIVFVNQVLEHVAEPIGFLEQMAARLAPGGVLYVEVPHADQRFKANVFPHTLFFTSRSLSAITESAGLRTLNCEAFGTLPDSQPAVRRLSGKVLLRLGSVADAGFVSSAGDDLLFDYAARNDGIWLRWLGSRA